MDTENRKGRKPISFTDDVIQLILITLQRNKPLQFSKPVIDRFMKETGFIERVPNLRLPGERGAVGFSLNITSKGNNWLIGRRKEIENLHKLAGQIKTPVKENRDAMASKLLDSASKLRKKSDALLALANEKRREADYVAIN